MKKTGLLILLLCLFAVTAVGCMGALKSAPMDTALNKDVEMVEDKDLGRVYLTPGFNFKGYDTFFVSDCSSSGGVQNNEIDPQEMRLYLKNQFVKKLTETGIFPTVTGSKSDLLSGEGLSSKSLVLNCVITELDPGNRALRYLVGFGAGASKVQVENEIRDIQTGELFFKSSDRRVAAFGAFGGNSKEFILASFDQTAEALCSVIKRASSGDKVGINPQGKAGGSDE